MRTPKSTATKGFLMYVFGRAKECIKKKNADGDGLKLCSCEIYVEEDGYEYY